MRAHSPTKVHGLPQEVAVDGPFGSAHLILRFPRGLTCLLGRNLMLKLKSVLDVLGTLLLDPPPLCVQIVLGCHLRRGLRGAFEVLHLLFPAVPLSHLLEEELLVALPVSLQPLNPLELRLLRQAVGLLQLLHDVCIAVEVLPTALGQGRRNRRGCPDGRDVLLVPGLLVLKHLVVLPDLLLLLLPLHHPLGVPLLLFLQHLRGVLGLLHLLFHLSVMKHLHLLIELPRGLLHEHLVLFLLSPLLGLAQLVYPGALNFPLSIHLERPALCLVLQRRLRRLPALELGLLVLEELLLLFSSPLLLLLLFLDLYLQFTPHLALLTAHGLPLMHLLLVLQEL
mmetsp:Transcript_40845/g.129789  ORF Transcript_40845/g.129789 Transcript_40845/m.129789 type:complete len:338 (+) Transcript_40845:103-1116(+)